ncbi:MAG: cytochrome c, partial [Planctomycetota bacterium]
MSFRRLTTIFAIALCVCVTSCDVPIDRFGSNTVMLATLTHRGMEIADAQAADLAAVMDEQFGTPDQPRLPDGLPSQVHTLLDLDELERCGGNVSSDKSDIHHGMFREHCVSCHGINGNGAGPTASVQFPYPRNFRMGIFKWKSTRRASMPTIDDIAGTLRRGIAGTAMPTFALQAPEDRQALAQYVVFLSIRGQTERQCMQLLADEPA